MKNFCGKCGCKLDETTGMCPKCSGKNGSKKKTVIIVAVVCACVLVGLVSTAFAMGVFGGEDEITATDTVATNAQTEALEETETPTEAQIDFVSDKYVVDCGNKAAFVDSEGVWVFERDDIRPQCILECEATNIASDGKKIYYCQFNNTVVGEYGDKYQYDMYSVNFDGTENEKIVSCYGDGCPVYVKDDMVYYCDYDSDYYDISPAGLSRSLYVFDRKSGDRKLITKEADKACYYDGKIYYRTIVVSTDTSKAQVYSYDIETQEISAVTDEPAVDWVLDQGKIIYTSATDYGMIDKVHVLDLDTNENKCMVTTDAVEGSKNLSVSYLSADTICFTVDNEFSKLYLYDIKQETLSVVDGLVGDDLYSAFDLDGSVYIYYNVYGDYKTVYGYSGLDSSLTEPKLRCNGREIAGSFDNRIYLVGGDNYYSYDISVYDMEG